MTKHDLTAGRITAIVAIIGLVTALIYLLIAVGAGSTEYDCQAKDSCSKTIVEKCKKCELQSTTTGILSQMRSGSDCGANPFKSVENAGGPSPP